MTEAEAYELVAITLATISALAWPAVILYLAWIIRSGLRGE